MLPLLLLLRAMALLVILLARLAVDGLLILRSCRACISNMSRAFLALTRSSLLWRSLAIVEPFSEFTELSAGDGYIDDGILSVVSGSEGNPLLGGGPGLGGALIGMYGE